jgi:hypothetical protein
MHGNSRRHLTPDDRTFQLKHDHMTLRLGREPGSVDELLVALAARYGDAGGA